MEVRSENVSVTQREQLKGYVIDYAEEIDGYLYVNDSTHTTSTDIIRTQLREKFDVIMIDHLTLLKDKPWRGERHDQKLGRISMAMHELAKNTNCVVLLLAQLNRNLEQRQDKRPTMADLRDSGELEQNADNVALIYGEWYYDPQADNITEINFGKYRDGVKDRTAYVKFNKSDQQFDSVTQKELDEMSEEEMEQAHETEGGHTQINAQQEIPF
jgi:replicative DNA helicase